MQSVLDKLIQKPKTENADSLYSKKSLLMLFNPRNGCFLQQFAYNMHVELR